MREALTTICAAMKSSRPNALQWSVRLKHILQMTQQEHLCALVRSAMIPLPTSTLVATLVRLARLWCVHQKLMSQTAWRQNQSVSELPVTIRLQIWTLAASPARRAQSCLVVLGGLQTRMPRLVCVSDHHVTRAQEICRRAAPRTRVLRFHSQPGLSPTTQLAMRAVLDWY